MSSQTLRPYQDECVNAIFDNLDMGFRKLLYTMATGCGKTSTFAELTRIFRHYNDYDVLIVAHRTELISQAFERIKDHLGLSDMEIGIEQAESRAPFCARIIVATIQTMASVRRAPHFKPNVIIFDEAHRCAGSTYRRLMERFPESIIIGCTATAKRTDKKSLYAVGIDGNPVQLVDSKKRQFTATSETCVFEKLVYEFSVFEAIEAGWLVPIKGHTVQTDLDLSGVKTGIDGDFSEGELSKAVINAERTNTAIAAWEKAAQTRPTLVFCAGVEHAHHAAEMWTRKGYVAVALDGETDKFTRANTLERFRRGQVQILCNCGLFTEGTDLPTVSCIVHLRPTKSWTLYVQMTGRGTRALSGVLDGLTEPDARIAAIKNSLKPECIVVDVVDNYDKNDLCAVPSILDLPATLDLEGQSLTEAKRMLDEFEEVRERVIGECPKTFSELQVRLVQVDLLKNSARPEKQDFKAIDGGFRYVRVPPGYAAELRSIGEGKFTLSVRAGNETLLERIGKPSHFDAYLQSAKRWADHVIGERQSTMMASKSRGTASRLSAGQVRCLKANRHTDSEIDCMPYAKAKALIGTYMSAWKAKQSSTVDMDA